MVHPRKISTPEVRGNERFLFSTDVRSQEVRKTTWLNSGKRLENSNVYREMLSRNSIFQKSGRSQK